MNLRSTQFSIIMFFVPGLIIANPFHNLCHLTSFVSLISGRQRTSREAVKSRQPCGTWLIWGGNNYCLHSPFKGMLICISPAQVLCASKGG